MCVLALAWRAHPRWRLVLAGNRDELHARPAAPLHRWPEAPHLLAGQDLASGGTWLGVSEQGRLAVVTNLSGFGPPDPSKASRGALVKDALAGEGRYAMLTPADLDDFNPFNLATVTHGHAVFWRNRPEAGGRPLPDGVHGLSNGNADLPWPKTLLLMDAMLRWLPSEAADPEDLLDALRSEARPEGAASLPGSAGSPVFVRNAVYGTRCSTVVMVDVRGQGRIIERRFDDKGHDVGTTDLAFAWPDGD